MQLDNGFHPKSNNIAKASLHLKVFRFFHGVCSLFTLSDDPFHKARTWVVLSLDLKRKKAQAYVNLENGLGLTTCKVQQVGLWAFVSLGAPGACFFKHRSNKRYRKQKRKPMNT